jgi:hypothetical protein
MKTKVTYEESDIRLSDKVGTKGDPLHDFLMLQFLLALIVGPKAPRGHEDDKLYQLRVMIAMFLTAAEEEGWVITKSELPAAFGDAFSGGSVS